LLLAASVLAPFAQPALGGTYADAGRPGHGSSGPLKGINIRVMTFNIQHGADEDGDLDLESVADDIESAKAQIVGLQEVDRHRSARSDFVDQAKWLAKELGMHFAFGLNRKTPPQGKHHRAGLHGVAVLSKFPIVSADNHMLTNIKYKKKPTKQRSVLHVVINVEGTKIDFYNTHLDNRRPKQRHSQIREILALARHSSRPSILVGDFNSTPSSRTIRLAKTMFSDVLAILDDGDEDTFPTDDPEARLDYILTRGGISARWAEVVDTDSSDHLPVLAGLTIKNPAAKTAGSPRHQTKAVPVKPPFGPLLPRPRRPFWF
jgi:endonuclease/exonuclease/phosphatase family metal-dependent hydrolase